MNVHATTLVTLLCLALLLPLFLSAEDTPSSTSAPNFIKDGVLDVDAAIAYFDDLYRSSSSTGEVEMTVVRPRRTLTMRMKLWTEGTSKSLVVIQSPPREQGTATLKVDNNLWNYMPRIKRTVRIPPSMMLASWMGSDFTNDDLVRESSMLEDYTYETVGRSEEPNGWLIRCTVKPDVVGLWNRIDLIVSEDGTLPIQAAYYDRKDRLSRTLYWSDVQEMGNRILPATMRLVPEDEEGHETAMRYLDIEFDVTLPADTFSLSRLEQRP